MNLAEFKIDIIKAVIDIKDEDFIMDLHIDVLTKFNEENDTGEIPEHVLKALTDAKKSIAKGEYKTHEEVVKDTEEWLNSLD